MSKVIASKVESPTIKYGKGSYFVPSGRKPWPHEIKSAEALSDAGYKVDFLVEDQNKGGADAKINGLIYEFKAPTSDKLDAVERNLKKALIKKNVEYVVFDSRRYKKIPDVAIERELSAQLKKTLPLKGIIFINRKAEIVDINKKV